MKETKRAEFDNIGLDAVFVNGSLDHLSVWGKGLEPVDITELEGLQLYSWLGSLWPAAAVGAVYTRPAPMPEIQAVGIAPNRGGGGHISDAQSVKNRVPLDRALASEGMKLDDLSSRISAPVQVRIEK